MDDLIPIGEFSGLSGLSPKRLRTYATEGLLVPAAVDSSSGYRYYSPGQVREANLIDTLRQAGMPLAEIRLFLREPSAAQLDAWAQRLEVDAGHRQNALGRARQLLVVEVPSAPKNDESSGDLQMTKLNTAARTETGPVRENNEDAIITNDRLAVLADGMGGLPGGEIAAGTATTLVEAAFTGRSLDELEAGVRAANRAIWERAGVSSELEGMGTTICTAGLLDDGLVAVVNVGDSRAYLWHGDTLTQLTEDHSVTAELVRRGELAEEDAHCHPHYGVLTRVLGVGPDVDPEGATHPLVQGDRLLLCSDGLFNEMSNEEMSNVMARGEDIKATAESLVTLATSREARDNVSVVVAEVSA